MVDKNYSIGVNEIGIIGAIIILPPLIAGTVNIDRNIHGTGIYWPVPTPFKRSATIAFLSP